MELRVLRYFLMVAKEQSFTKAAEQVMEMMNKGLVEVGLFMEPVATEDLDYIRIQDSDKWVVGMKPDDPLAAKEYITKEDLLELPLILPERYSVQNELANWFGREFERLDIAFTSLLFITPVRVRIM